MHLPRRFRRFFYAPLVLFALALSGCAKDAPQDTFQPEGEMTRRITRLARPVFIIAIVIGIFVYVLIAMCIVKFRRRDDDHVPKQVHGNTKLELFWGAVPAMILAGVGVFSVGEIFEQAENPKDAYEIGVIGHQWWWEYQYPQPGNEKLKATVTTVVDPADVEAAAAEGREPKKIGGIFDAGVPVITSANELHVPAGRTIRLRISSRDVMHNYWVPKLAGKIYAIPGKVNSLLLKTDADDAGKTIYGQCAEFCGTSHANMRFKVKIDSPADFDAWLANEAKPAPAPTTDLAKAGEELFNGGAACSSCHWLEPARTNGYETTKNAEGVDETLLKIGPNLAHFGGREHFASALAESNTANLKAWLRNPQEFKPGSRMVIRKLTEDEVTKLVAYLQSLK